MCSCALSDFDSLSEEDMAENNQLAFDVAERQFGIQPVTRGEEMAAQAEPDQLLTVLYLSRFYEVFRVSPGNSSGQVPSCSCALFISPRFRRSVQPTASVTRDSERKKLLKLKQELLAFLLSAGEQRKFQFGSSLSNYL